MIKERVKVEPKNTINPKRDFTTASVHTFKIEVSWQETEKEAQLLALTKPPNSTIQDEDWVSGGISTLTVEFTTYGYLKIQVRSWDLREVDYIVTLDDEIVKIGTLQLLYASYGIPRHNEISYEIPLYTGIDFTVENNSCRDEAYIGFTLEQIVGNEIKWNIDEDLINISVSGGGGKISLANESMTLIGSSVTFEYSSEEEWKYKVIPTERPASGDVNVTISAGSYSGTESYYLNAEQYFIEGYFLTDILSIGDNKYIIYELGPRCPPRWSGPDVSLYKFNFEIIEGREVVDLVNNNTGETGDEITDIDYFQESVSLIVNGNSTESNAKVRLKISANSNDILPYEKEFSFTQPQLKVTITPSTLSPGDTALVTVQKIEDDGSLTEFPTNQGFEIGLLNGCGSANLSVYGNKDV